MRTPLLLGCLLVGISLNGCGLLFEGDYGPNVSVKYEDTSEKERLEQKADFYEQLDKKRAKEIREEAANTNADYNTVSFHSKAPLYFKETYYGNEEIGYEKFPYAPISVQKAIEKARPFLDRSFEIRKRISGQDQDKRPVIQVTLTNSYYYIIKDFYPSNISLTLKSVRIGIEKGEVFAPSE